MVPPMGTLPVLVTCRFHRKVSVLKTAVAAVAFGETFFRNDPLPPGSFAKVCETLSLADTVEGSVSVVAVRVALFSTVSAAPNTLDG